MPVALGSISPRAPYLALLIMAVAVVYWWIFRVRQSNPLAVPKAALPIFALILLQLICLRDSPQPTYGVYWAALALVFALSFLLFLDLFQDPCRAHYWELIYLFGGILVASLDVLYVLSWYLRWWGISGSLLVAPPISVRAPGVLLGHMNFLGGYLNLFIPFFVLRVIQERGSRRLFWLAGLGILLAALFYSASRSAWLALAAALATMGLLHANSQFGAHIGQSLLSRLRSTSRLRLFAGLVLALVLALAMGALVLRQASGTQHGNLSQRLDIWRYAFVQISTSPLLGHGPGSVAFLYSLRSQGIGVDEVAHAHNIWLQTGIVAGFLGIMLLICGGVLLVVAFLAAWQAAHLDRASQPSLLAAAGALVALFVHNQVDFLFDPPLLTISALMVLALFFRSALRSQFVFVANKHFLPALVVLSLLICAAIIFAHRGQILYERGRAAATRHDWALVRQEICQAAHKNPFHSLYGFQCALATSLDAAATGNKALLSKSVESARSSLAQDPYWYIQWANLATYEWQIGETSRAIGHLQKAIEIAPKNTTFRFNLAYMQEQSADLENAFQNYRLLFCINQGMKSFPFFTLTPTRRQAVLEGCPLAVESVSQTPYQAHFEAGVLAIDQDDLITAAAEFNLAIQADRYQAAPYAYLGWIQQQNGNPEAAWKLVDTALFVNSGDARANLLAAQVSEAQGRSAQAVAYRLNAFDILSLPSVTSRQVYGLYRALGLPTDSSPYFYHPGLSEELVEVFGNLAIDLESEGNHRKSAEIARWLEFNTSLLGKE